MSDLGKMEKWSYSRKLSYGQRVFFVGSKNAIQLLHVLESSLEDWRSFYDNLMQSLFAIYDELQDGHFDDAFGYLVQIVSELRSTPCGRYVTRYKTWKKKGGKNA